IRNDDRRPTMSSGFALRVAILGGAALVMFAVIFFRLWYLQVLSGDKYLAEANNNRIREIRVTAPRGEILDRNGHVLVENRTSLALQVNPQKLPGHVRERRAELARLGHAAGIPVRRMRRDMSEQLKVSRSAPVTLQRDVNYDLVYYLQEHQANFPGVAVQRIFVRRYPDGTLGAHLFGNVGEINSKELKEPRYKGLKPGDQIGQDGVEYQYDRYLRGRDGQTRVQVDSLGRPTPGGQLSAVPPKPGDNLQLSIDSGVQAAGESGLASLGLPGAFVAMDVRNGQVLGLGSFPTFDPSIFTKPITQSQYKQLTSNTTDAPLTDRAIRGLYPTGSTFKPITAMAALTGGVITPATPITDTGGLTVGGITFHNAGGGAYGTLSLPSALQVSDDVFFYTLGLRMNGTLQLQKWAHRLGIGTPTGIDLPGESAGLLPTPGWRNRLYRKHLTDRPWSAGDNINLAVGQGDVQVDPLQLADAYAAIGNGGTLLRPHVGMQVVDTAGRVVQELNPSPRRHIPINPGYRSAILDGLHMAAQSPGGTSYAVFGGFPVPVAGKTGTAQRTGQADQSWYSVMAPYPNPRVVVTVTIERGGFGVDSAAPVAEQILSQYFHARPHSIGGANGGSQY
ncbi:MAG: penicillin-binding protein 2, partial [Actinomycetota bacterium]|nr:penicillin-binding protein 2 [Actinomycetota bacterium]